MRELKFRTGHKGRMWDVIAWDISGFKSLRSLDEKEVVAWVYTDSRLLEYTGHKDKNGKEIYEGDYDSDGHMVVFCNNCAGWQFGHIDIPTKDLAIDCHACEGHFMFRDHVGEFEIFGNVIECNE